MKNFLNIFITVNGFAAFYQLLVFFRHLAYRQLDGLLDPILPGLIFLALTLAGYLLRQVKSQSIVSTRKATT